jgi:hypothetical protein
MLPADESQLDDLVRHREAGEHRLTGPFDDLVSVRTSSPRTPRSVASHSFWTNRKYSSNLGQRLPRPSSSTTGKTAVATVLITAVAALIAGLAARTSRRADVT